MVDDGTTQAADGIYIVRQGKGEDARYAICAPITTVEASYRIAGNSKTVAELVDEQNLDAAYVEGDKEGGIRVSTFEGQSGRNFSLVETPR